MMILTIAVTGEILANGYIIWLFLMNFPAKCARLTAETAGQQTCSLEAGAYVIAITSAVLILVGVCFPAKWNFPESKHLDYPDLPGT